MTESNQGFFVVAQNSLDCDYIKQAYYLAKSIERSQSTVKKISLMTNDTVPAEYVSAFDKIIKIPFEDHALNSEWKVQNRWKAYHATPYEHTILLDADMLILSDLNYAWKKLQDKNLYFTSQVKNFRGNILTDRVYRKTFIENSLPNLYSGFCYFKKSDESLEFWKLVEFITYNWEKFYGEFSPKNYQKFYSLDVTISIAAKILGLENCFDNNQICSFTHMKSLIQGWNTVHPDWTKVAQVEIIDADTIYINQFKQSGVLHYVEDSFLENYITYAS
jgi:hypothetical protein